MTMPPLPPPVFAIATPVPMIAYSSAQMQEIREYAAQVTVERDALAQQAVDVVAGYERQGAELDKIADERDALRTGLADAIECVKSWGAYATPYFRDKWDLDADIKRLEAVLTGEKT